MQKMRKMKDSGIEWIGEIPERWEIHRIKTHFSIISGSGFKPELQGQSTGDFPVCKASDISTSGHYLHTSANYITSDIVKSQHFSIIPKGSILFAKIGEAMRKNNRSLCLLDCCVDNNCQGLVPKNISSEFSYYLFTCIDMTWFDNAGTIPCINNQKLYDCRIPFPSYDEQLLIANHLNIQCDKINEMLFHIRSSIEEYKKLKQAVITQAVTKGVRGEREMKDSGVEWIGEIPKEWRKTQLRHCATIKSGITLGKSYSKDTVLIERPYLRVANVQGGYVDLNDLATIQVTPDEDLKYRLHSGDVLMTEGGDRDKLGRGCVWHGEIEPCLHQNHVFAVQTNETILLPEFLEYLTASDVGRSYFDVTAIKTTNLACTSSSKVLAFTIPLPPIEEQIEIVSFIKKRSLELNKLIMKKELLVQELESYKKSLIYEVVTGKREV